MAENKRVPGLGARIKRAREALGETQAELANRMGWRQAELSKVETAERNPSGARVVELARALGVSADHLLGLSSVPAKASRKPQDRRKAR